MSDKISLSPVEIAAFNDLQRQFNRMMMEIIDHRAEDVSAQWQLVMHDNKTGFLIKVPQKSDKKPEPEQNTQVK